MIFGSERPTKGLFKYNFINGNADHYLGNTGNVKSIIDYSDQELIMGTDKGLIIFNKETGNFRIPKRNPDTRIYPIIRFSQ